MKIGDHCPRCKRIITKEIVDMLKKSKSDNAKRSLAKAKANGSKLGRPKIRDDAKINELRCKGFTIREIALILKISSSAVQRGLIKDTEQTRRRVEGEKINIEQYKAKRLGE